MSKMLSTNERKVVSVNVLSVNKSTLREFILGVPLKQILSHRKYPRRSN
jgi:hypothetical protein